MSENRDNTISEVAVNDRLRRIANILLLNASFIDNLGLLKGKVGIAIFFYHYARCTQNKIFEDYAGELIDEIYEEINTNTPVNFENGLTGIGWGIEYLVKNKFVQADTDEALKEIDNAVYRIRLQSPILIKNQNEIFGYGLYYISRICGHTIDDHNLDTLIKKYHLIFLVDECERILKQRLYLKYNIESLRIDSLNSFIWFLLEVNRLKIFPVKVIEILNCMPEYIKEVQDYSDNSPAWLLLSDLIKKTVETVSDSDARDSLTELLRKKKGKFDNNEVNNEAAIEYFIRNTWQQVIYNSRVTEESEDRLIFLNVFNIVDNEQNWTDVVNKLNKDNLGLTGLAGLGLGLLMAQYSQLKTECAKQLVDKLIK